MEIFRFLCSPKIDASVYVFVVIDYFGIKIWFVLFHLALPNDRQTIAKKNKSYKTRFGLF